jgi:hypothetical protein
LETHVVQRAIFSCEVGTDVEIQLQNFAKHGLLVEVVIFAVVRTISGSAP